MDFDIAFTFRLRSPPQPSMFCGDCATRPYDYRESGRCVDGFLVALYHLVLMDTALIEYRLVVQNTTENTSENTTQNTSRIEHCPEYNRIRDRIQQNTCDELVFYVWRRLGASSSEESDSHCKAGRTFRLYPPIFFAF